MAWGQLRSRLFQRTDVETAGLLLGDHMSTPLGDIIAVRHALPLPDDAYNIRAIDRISINPVALNRLIRPARDNNQSVLTIHTHPGASEAWFSAADDAGDARLMPSLHCQIDDATHGSIVVTSNGDAAARVFRCDGISERADIQIVGRTLTAPRGPALPSEPWFSRQELALGAKGHAQLRRLRIAVIGLGGIGSLVSMQLAHLGVGQLVLVDGDIVEASNLSRIVGATKADVGHTSKVEVAARYAGSLGFSRVEQHREFFVPAHEALLAGCDVIVSCVDLQTPRALLNRIAYRHLVPVVDLGTVFRVDDAGAIIGDAGRVVVLGPGRPCLACWGHLDPHALRIEALSPEERDAEIRMGYIEGATEAQPSVIAFNTHVAGAGVIELMRIVTGFAGVENPPLRMQFSFSEGTVRRNTVARDPKCKICGGQ
jgi:molybdopterin-synthase adenylyltransferase